MVKRVKFWKLGIGGESLDVVGGQSELLEREIRRVGIDGVNALGLVLVADVMEEVGKLDVGELFLRAFRHEDRSISVELEQFCSRNEVIKAQGRWEDLIFKHCNSLQQSPDGRSEPRRRIKNDMVIGVQQNSQIEV